MPRAFVLFLNVPRKGTTTFSGFWQTFAFLNASRHHRIHGSTYPTYHRVFNVLLCAIAISGWKCQAQLPCISIRTLTMKRLQSEAAGRQSKPPLEEQLRTRYMELYASRLRFTATIECNLVHRRAWRPPPYTVPSCTQKRRPSHAN